MHELQGYGSVSTHSRAEAAAQIVFLTIKAIWFQHTAARRRLRAGSGPECIFCCCFNTQPRGGGCITTSYLCREGEVSTHSRAEAAAP